MAQGEPSTYNDRNDLDDHDDAAGAAKIGELAEALFPASAAAAEPRSAQDEAQPSKHAVADSLAKAFFEHDKALLTQGFVPIRTIVRTALANGRDRDDVARALHQLALEGRPVSGGTLAFALRQLHPATPVAIGAPSEATRSPSSRPVGDVVSQRGADETAPAENVATYADQARAAMRANRSATAPALVSHEPTPVAEPFPGLDGGDDGDGARTKF